MTAWIDRPDAWASLDAIIPLPDGRYGFHGWLWTSAKGQYRADFGLAEQGGRLDAFLRIDRPDVLQALEHRGRTQDGLTTFFAIIRFAPDTPPTTGSVQLEFLGDDQHAPFRLELTPSADASSLVDILERLVDGWDHPALQQLLSAQEGQAASALTKRLIERNRLPAADKVAGQLLDNIARDAPAARNTYAALLTGYIVHIGRMDAAYLDDGIRTRIADIAKLGRERRWLNASDAANLLATLHRLQMGPEAMKVAQALLNTLQNDRAALARSLQYILPADCRAWLARAVAAEGASSQDAYGVFNALGGSLAASNRRWDAEVMFAAAAAVHPANDIAKLNAGWMALARNDVDAAMTSFSGVRRAYPVQTSSALWPQAKGAPWPTAPLDPTGYAALEPPGGWPRISIVTPSYNQAEFIEDTLLSVLNQGYPNLQYIVVDGASSDGTREILERYRDRIDHLIIEPDGGQTEAINKGLRLADGELLGWLNSDDMFAPGALHVMAAAWRSTDADLLSGLCLEHADRRILLVNRPRATSERFNPQALADIFKYWLKGDYFYQPEVLFTRRALERIGGELDQSLFYTMDYDLWMKMALASCKVEIIDWPVALFRKHASQKTAKLVDCIEEQAQVRTKHCPLTLSARHTREIERRFCAFGAKERPKVAVITSRRQKIFSIDVENDLIAAFEDRADVAFAATAADPRALEADIVFHLVHLQNDCAQIADMRAARDDRPVIGWFWDNHHHPFVNHEVAEVLDVATPGHGAYAEYLRTNSSVLDETLPLCVTQWSRRQVAKWFPEVGGGARSSRLYGGFVRYSFAKERNAFLDACVRELPEHELLLLSEGDLSPYFGKTEKTRFAEWCRFKTSLVVPLHNDLSQRFFDALLAGQIPLVPQELTGFDEVISPELQETLPVIKFSMKDWRTVAAAHAQAVQAFDKEGLAGVERRHAFAAENHMFEGRIRALFERAVRRARQA